MSKTLKTILTILSIMVLSFLAVITFFTQVAFAVVIEFILIALLSCFALGIVGIALYFGYGYGKYKCLTCNNYFFPSPKNFLFSLWLPKKRYMKCPVCSKRHWCEKEVIKTEKKNDVIDVDYKVVNE